MKNLVIVLLVVLLALVFVAPMAQATIGVTSTLSYSAGPGTSLYLPVVYKNVYGGWTSGLNIMNTSQYNNNVFIQYRDSDGRPVGQLGIILPPFYTHRFTLLGSSVFPDNAYSAWVTSDYPLSIVINTNKEN